MKYDDLKAKADAATPGPWITGSIPGVVWHSGGLGVVCENFNSPEDRDYIAAANPAAIKQLIADYVKLRAELGDMLTAFRIATIGSTKEARISANELIAQAREILKETE